MSGTDFGGVSISPTVEGNAAKTQIESAGNSVLGIIQVVGTFIAVGMVSYIGIKYLIASAEEKANIKSTMFIYLIGAVALFAASQLAGMVYTFATRCF